MKRTRWPELVVGAVLAVGALAVGCQREGDLVGVAQVAIMQVPTSTFCVQITAAGSRTVVNRIDVMPGQSTTFSLKSLPSGSVTFTGLAFGVACSQVTTNDTATWITDPVVATLTAGVQVNVALVFRPNGRANVTGDFISDSTDGGTAPDLAMSSSTDGGSSADLSVSSSDGGTLLAAGAVCTSGSQCASGFCVAAQSGSLCATVSSCPTCTVINTTGTSCVFAVAGSDPKNECTANAATCVSDFCNGMGSCAATDGTTCGSADGGVHTCMGGVCI